MRIYGCLIAMACALGAQPVSSYRYIAKADGNTIEITNVSYHFNGTLVLRTTTRTTEFVGDQGMDAKTTTEAWKVGVDLKTKPLYSVTVEGKESRMVDEVLFVVSRGLEEVEWWSVYKAANGAHLFDTYVPLIKFSTSRERLITRYAGLEVPEDNHKDARLRDPHVVAVLSYASDEKLIREALITCDDVQQATRLRSFGDESRALTDNGGKSLRLTFSQNFPSPPGTVTMTIPIVGDDLDVAHATLPPKVHVAAWKR